MNDYSTELLFKALGQMLSNQHKIMKHLGIAKSDCYGYDTEDETRKLASECFNLAQEYEHDDY